MPQDRFKFKSSKKDMEDRGYKSKILLESKLKKIHGNAEGFRRACEADIGPHDWC